MYNHRTLWMNNDGTVCFVDQNQLPFNYSIVKTQSYSFLIEAIQNMNIRGAGAIGVAGAFAMALAFREYETHIKNDFFIDQVRKQISSARPTAYNLQYAVDKVYKAGLSGGYKHAFYQAQQIAEDDVEMSRKIAKYGYELIADKSNILTHCNAGQLAFVNYGTALAPIYYAIEQGAHIHVYVSETRPRLQGARLTAWELSRAKVPFTIISDSASAFLMKQKKVDAIIVGADRIACNGDTANKIGTLEKAIIAKFFDIPFYVAAPSTTFDLNCSDGEAIPIEYRSPDEILYLDGINSENIQQRIKITLDNVQALNPAFDITPNNLITFFITEYGIIKPNKESIEKMIKR